MKRRISLRAIAISVCAFLGAATLVACGNGADGSIADGKSKPIVVYSNSVSDGRGDWLKSKASEAGFELELVDLGGGDIKDRLTAEKANPIADVVFGLNNVYFGNLKAADVLAEFTPKWSGEVDAGVGDDKSFWPIVREPIMLISNDAAFENPAEAPQDWPDLWENEKFHGRYEVPSSLGGATTQLVISGILARHLDPSGDLHVSEDGWKAIEQYFKHGNRSIKGTDLFARMKTGDVVAGQMWLAGKASREKEYGLTTTPARPAIGVPMATQHVAKISGSKNPKSEEFIDWFGSAAVQAEWSKEFFTAPANKAAAVSANQDAVELTQSFEAQNINWQVVADKLPKWIEKIELQYK